MYAENEEPGAAWKDAVRAVIDKFAAQVHADRVVFLHWLRNNHYLDRYATDGEGKLDEIAREYAESKTRF